MKKLINLSEQDMHNIVRKAAAKIMNEGTMYSSDSLGRYAGDVADFVDKFEDSNGWDEDIKNEYGEEFFYKFDEDLFDAIQNAIQGVVNKYKSQM